MHSARENIFKRIELALTQKTEMPFPTAPVIDKIYFNSLASIKQKFIDRFSELDGQVVEFSDEETLKTYLENLIEDRKWLNICSSIPELIKNQSGPGNDSGNYINADACITDCEFLIARTGTILLSSAQSSGRLMPAYAPIHIVIANVEQLVEDIGDGIQSMRKKYGDNLPSGIFFASGPSRTADIEKTLVLGVHGPKEVFLFLRTGSQGIKTIN